MHASAGWPLWLCRNTHHRRCSLVFLIERPEHIIICGRYHWKDIYEKHNQMVHGALGAKRRKKNGKRCIRQMTGHSYQNLILIISP